jgi:putative PIG3 family NAD(P)H quinone oxidoreductase
MMKNFAVSNTMTEIHISRAGNANVLQPRNVPIPQPGRGEVLIQVHAAGINRPDVIQRRGLYPLPEGANPTPGLEVAGIVVGLGEETTGFAVGDRVCALVNGGGYAEYCAAPAGQTLPIPEGMDMQHAAAIPEAFFTVWANLFVLGKAKRGENVLIHGGTSGIGTTAIMLGRELGLTMYATVGSAPKADFIRTLGATPINYSDEDFVQTIDKHTSGRGVDVILDIMGASYLERNFNALARDGRLVIVGFLGGAIAEKVNLMTFAEKRISVTGSLMRPRTDAEKAVLAKDLRERIWPVLSAGRCWPVLDLVYPLAAAADAHRRMESGAHIGKIVLQVSDASTS